MPTSRSAVELFTPDEHAVLAKWFGVQPPRRAKDIVVDQAVKRLGFVEKPPEFRLIDAATAFIALEGAKKRVSQWSVLNKHSGQILAQQYRRGTRVPDRKGLLKPRRLFCINWADSGPGVSWPEDYYVTWLPYYDRFLLTTSNEDPDIFGYSHFALGTFDIDTLLKKGAKEIICRRWTFQKKEYKQSRALGNSRFTKRGSGHVDYVVYISDRA